MLDDAYAQAFTQRFDTWPEWNRPELWPIVTDPKRSEQRRWLSDALSTLPAVQGAKLLGRLESNRSFQATYNELATAVLLRQSGLKVDFEPELPWQGKVLTPDIGLRGSDGGLAVIVEVSTKFRTAEQRSQEVEWNQLRNRVSRIPRPLGLAVRQLLPGPTRPPDSGQSIRIEAVLRGWLLRASTTVGSVCDAEGYLFQVVAPLPGMRAAVAAPTGTDWYNTDMVRKAINVKVNRYADAADSLAVLLVVVLAAELAMPISIDMVRSALAGKQALSIAIDPFVMTPASTGPMRLNDPQCARQVPPGSVHGWLATARRGCARVLDLLRCSQCGSENGHPQRKCPARGAAHLRAVTARR